MSNIKKVFLIIGTLVLAFIVWSLVFNDGGIVKTAYNAIISPVNSAWQTITGDSQAKLLPEWGDTGVQIEKNLNDQRSSNF